MSAGHASGSGPFGAGSSPIPESITIPSYGLEYFEYRRRLFLAGKPIPVPPDSLPATYTIPLPLPEPILARPRASSSSNGIGRLESLLNVDGELGNDIAWKAGIGSVHHALTEKRRLTKPLRLDLVIQILRAGWVRDGTWPIDPKTKRPLDPPDSPMISNMPLDPPQPSKSVQPEVLEESDWVDEERMEEVDPEPGVTLSSMARSQPGTIDHG